MARAKSFEKLYEVTGYRFKNEKLLKNALTHSSYASEQKLGYEHNNERLEFIGDAEGKLSRCRADVVCESSLAEAAAEMGLGEFLYLGRGEESSGGREKASILADAFEALIGSIILDGGYDAGREVILRLLKDKIKLGAEGKLNKDYKTRLQEKLQETDHNVRIEYRMVAESGPDHNKVFTIEVLINGRTAGSGTGQSKAKAEQAAAEDALSKGV